MIDWLCGGREAEMLRDPHLRIEGAEEAEYRLQAPSPPILLTDQKLELGLRKWANVTGVVTFMLFRLQANFKTGSCN